MALGSLARRPPGVPSYAWNPPASCSTWNRPTSCSTWNRPARCSTWNPQTLGELPPSDLRDPRTLRYIAPRHLCEPQPLAHGRLRASTSCPSYLPGTPRETPSQVCRTCRVLHASPSSVLAYLGPTIDEPLPTTDVLQRHAHETLEPDEVTESHYWRGSRARTSRRQ